MSEDFLKLTEKVFKETARCSFVSDRHLAEVTNFFKYFLVVMGKSKRHSKRRILAEGIRTLYLNNLAEFIKR